MPTPPLTDSYYYPVVRTLQADRMHAPHRRVNNDLLYAYGFRLKPCHQPRFASLTADSALFRTAERGKHIRVMEGVYANIATLKLGRNTKHTGNVFRVDLCYSGQSATESPSVRF